MTTITDPVVLAAIDGDERAFEVLVRRHRPGLHRRCARILGHADADDAVQETLVRAWRRIESFEGRSTFATWLHSIATNTCLDSLRRQARAPHLVGDAVLDERAARGDDDPADAMVRRDELRRATLTARRALTDRQHSVLVLRKVLHLTAAETAAHRGESVASVNSSLQRARAALRGTRDAAFLASA